MDARSAFDPKLYPLVGDLDGAANRSSRSVERRVEPVPGSVVLNTAPAFQRRPNNRVVTLEKLFPRAVFSSAALAVIVLNVDPGRYRSWNACETSGLSGSAISVCQ